MLLIDFSAISYAAFYANPERDTSEGILRHMILNSIRMYISQYSKQYGDVYIVCDSSSWRKGVFPYYKKSRENKAQTPKEKEMWEQFYSNLALLREELEEYFPYYVVKSEGAEADDIITYLVEETQWDFREEPVMIISGDHDFEQLQRYSNVEQFSPSAKKKVKVENPMKTTFEMILRGCSGDEVPNILSDDDTFVNPDKKQTPLRSKKVDTLFDIYVEKGEQGVKDVLNEQEKARFERNKALVYLSSASLPKSVLEGIIESLGKARGKEKTNKNIRDYLIKKRCHNLLESVRDFFVK